MATFWKFVIPLAVGVIVTCGALFGFATFQHGAELEITTKTLVSKTSAAVKASNLAVDQVAHDQAFIYAICKRFHRDEVSRAKATAKAAETERKYPHPNPGDPLDVRYHAERIANVSTTAQEARDIANFNCPKAMTIAIKEAPTPSPTPNMTDGP